MKKLVLVAAALVIALGSFTMITGCKKSEPSSTPPPAQPEGNEPAATPPPPPAQ